MTSEEAKEYIYDCLDHSEATEIIKALEQQPCEDCISREEMLKYQQYLHGKMSNEENHKLWNFIKGLPSVTPRRDLAETSQDCISRQAVLDVINFEDEWLFDAKSYNADTKIAFSAIKSKISELPPVTPQYTDEEIDKAQAVEQAYVEKMVELAVEESRREWLNSFDTSSATKCFEAVNLLKQRLEGGE